MRTATHLSAVALAVLLAAAAGQRLDGQVLRDDVEVRVNVLFEYGLTMLTCQEGSGDCVGFRLSGVDAGHRLGGQVCRKAAGSKTLKCGPLVGATGASFTIGSNHTLRTSLYQPPTYLPTPRRRRRDDSDSEDDPGVYFTVLAGASGGQGQLQVRLPEAVNKWGNLWVTTDLGPVQYVPSAREMGQPLLAGQSARVHYSTRVSSTLGGDYSSRLRIALCAVAGSRPGRCRLVQLVGSAAKGAYLREAYDADSITSTDWTSVRARDTSSWPFAAEDRHTFVVKRRSDELLAVWSEANSADVYLVPLEADLVNLWVYSYSAVTFLDTDIPPATQHTTSSATPTSAPTTTADHSTPYWEKSMRHQTSDWGSKTPDWEASRGYPSPDWGSKTYYQDSARGYPTHDWGSKTYDQDSARGYPTHDWGSKTYGQDSARGYPTHDWGSETSNWEATKGHDTSDSGRKTTSDLQTTQGYPTSSDEETQTPPWPPIPTPRRCHNSFQNLLIPVDDDCGSYVVCYSGRSQLMPCAPGTHFNYRLQTCDWPQNVHCSASRRGWHWNSYGGYH